MVLVKNALQRAKFAHFALLRVLCENLANMKNQFVLALAVLLTSITGFSQDEKLKREIETINSQTSIGFSEKNLPVLKHYDPESVCMPEFNRTLYNKKDVVCIGKEHFIREKDRRAAAD